MAKYRNGFVSNSSTTSFCIYGTVLGYTEWLDKLGLSEGDDETDDLADTLEHMFPGLYAHYGSDGEYYLGRKFTSIKDDETGKQFKDSVYQKLVEKLGTDVKVAIFEESFYS